MIPKMNLSDAQIKTCVSRICRNITNDSWKPDYVVGIIRGGIIPAVMISHWFKVPMYTMKVSLRDGGECESVPFLADEAIGYVDEDDKELLKCRWDIHRRRNILIVDDINDSGATIDWIKNDWQASSLPNDGSWETVWGNNVRFAVLVENLGSAETTDYNAIEINKSEKDVWINFPWENWWDHDTQI